jgi:hypothetical protein
VRFKFIVVVPALALSLVSLSACSATEDKAQRSAASPVQTERVAATQAANYSPIRANPAASGKSGGLDLER